MYVILNFQMPLGKKHKAATRARIVASAGSVFRARGVAAASVGAVMAEAGLTHGGFYAHFESKEALFAEIMANDHGFIRLLERRRPGSPARWRRQTAAIFADYLAPQHLDEVARGCSFAALSGDSARADPAVRAAYRLAWRRLVGEVLRASGEYAGIAYVRAKARTRESATLLVGMAVGAVALARILAPDPMAAILLRGAAKQARRTLANLS